MLKQRVITSFALLLMIILIFFAIPDSWFAIAALLLCLMAIYELTTMYKFDKINQLGFIAAFILLALCLYFIHYDVSQFIKTLAICTWCFIVPFILIKRPKHFSKIMIGIFAIVIFIPTFYALIMLHSWLGSWQLLTLMAVAWVADIGAYFVGRKYGHHKLVPQISPAKSIEGAVAGLGCTIIYLLLLKSFNLAIYLPDYAAVFRFSLILVSAAIAGDLFESWLKRVALVKDSGAILPGHGGVFDRIDSLVSVLAISFVMIRGI
jgi:phosphatidate cytidylyltransferase